MPSLAELASLIDGTVVGDAQRAISDIAPLSAAGPQHLSFLANAKYRPALRDTRAGGVLVRRDWAEGLEANLGTSLVLCTDPYLAMARLLNVLRPQVRPPAGRHERAIVAASAQIDPTSVLEAGCIVGDGARIGARTWLRSGCIVGRGVRIGEDCLLHSGAVVLDGCVLGDRVILQAGAIIGSDGFGYAPDTGGVRHKIPQVGVVVLEDDVEVGANSTIDRATFGETRIGRGTKIDNLVQIAHNVSTGEHCVIVSQSGIAGSTTLGHRVVLGAQVGVVGHIRVADNVMVGARGGLAGDIDQPGVYSGAPAMPHAEWRRMVVVQSQLPELRRQLKDLSARLRALEDPAKE